MNFEQLIYVLYPATTSISETANLVDDAQTVEKMLIPISIIKTINVAFILIAITAWFNVIFNKDLLSRVNPTTMWVVAILSILCLLGNVVSIYYYIQQYTAQISNTLSSVTGGISNVSNSLSDNIEVLTNTTTADYSQMINYGVYIVGIIAAYFGIQYAIQYKTRINELYSQLPLEAFFILALAAISSINEAIMLFGKQNGEFQPIGITTIVLMTLKIIFCMGSLLLCAYVLFVYGKDMNKKINKIPASILILSILITLGSSLYSLFLLAKKNLVSGCIPVIQGITAVIFIIFTIGALLIKFRTEATQMVEYTASKSMLLG